MRDKLIKLLQTPHKAEELRKAGKTLPANDGCVEEIVADFLIINGVTIKTKPRTNFDRITESAEELAAFINRVAGCCYDDCDCASCPLYNGNDWCSIKTIFEWLQKEVVQE